MAKKTNYLGRMAFKLNLESKITIYNTCIAPHLNYCSTILYQSSETQIQRLQKIQNKAMRYILNMNRFTNTNVMLNTLEWLNVKQKIYYNTMILIFKAKNKMLPDYINDKFKIVDHNRILRDNVKFKIPNFKKEYTKNTIFCNGSRFFNMLRMETKNETNLSKFKKLVIEEIKNRIK